MTAPESAANQDGWSALVDWSSSSRMNELEGVMWRGERHPEFSSAGVVVEILETEPDWDRFRDAFRWASEVVTRLRQVVVEPALPTGPPAWQVDDAFDLDEHRGRASLPAPGEMAERNDGAYPVAATVDLSTGLDGRRARGHRPAPAR